MVKEGEKIMKGLVNENYFHSARCVGTHDREYNDNMDAKKQPLKLMVFVL